MKLHSFLILLPLCGLFACGSASNNSSAENTSATAGQMDTTFYSNFGTGLNGLVSTLANAGSSKVWVGGDFTTFKGQTAKRIARIYNDGRIDETLRSNLGSGFEGGMVRALVIQANGAVIVGGDFTSFNGISVPHLARISVDGALDTNFKSNLAGGPDDSVYALAIDSSGNIIVGGTFSQFSSRSSAGIAKISSSGSIDHSFSNAIGSGASEIFALSILPDGKIIAGGRFSLFNAINTRNIIRLNSNGTLDNTYLTIAASAFNDSVLTLALDSASQWLIGGNFSSFSTQAAVRFLRLRSTGITGTTYAVAGGGFNSTVRTLAPQSDGKLIVGGDFTAVGGVSRPYLVRLASDLSVDENFHTSLGSGPSGSVYSLCFDSEGKLLVGGSFTSFNSNAIGNLVRLK